MGTVAETIDLEESKVPRTLPAVQSVPGVDVKLPETMHVVHLLKHCGYGNGNVHVAVDLACVQAKAGYKVTFLSAGGTFVPLLEQYGVQHITTVQDQRKPFSLLKAAWRVGRFARKTRPDALHAHMMGSALVGYVASKLSGVPLVTTVHNSFDRHSRLMCLARRVVAVSHAEQESLRKQGYGAGKLTTVMNAPDKSPREAFMRSDRELTLQSPCIVAANGLHRRKGVFDLIEACSLLFNNFPKWHLYIAGEGPDRASLEEQVRVAGLEQRITFLGFLPSPRPLLQKADIFVLASYADPGSLAIGEARAAGCAIVATRVGGTPEMLEFGRAGHLVSPGDPKDLAEALRHLMQDDKAREDLRLAAHTGSEVFDVHRLVSDYGQVYRDAMRPKASPHA